MNWKKFLLVLGLGVVGVWVLFQSSAFPGFQAWQQGAYAWILANQPFIALILLILTVIFIFVLGSPDGRRLTRINIPPSNAVTAPEALESLLKPGDEYHDWLYASLNEFYHPYEPLPTKLSSKGVHEIRFSAKDGFLPNGLHRVELIQLASGLIPNPFMEGSRLLGRASEERTWVVNRAKKLGDIAYEGLGTGDIKDMVSRWAEDNPEVAASFLSGNLQKAIEK